MLIHSDCLEALRNLPDNSVDSVVTDPPYGLSFMGKRWDYDVPSVDIWQECLRVLKPGGHLLSFAGSRTYHRITCAIEDAGFEIRDQIMWVYGSGFPKSLDVGKAIDKMQGAERTETVWKDRYHDARTRSTQERGSATISFGCDANGNIVTLPATPEAKQWDGWGTALKPAHEPICVARKPVEGTVAANVLKWGTGGINIDGCRVGTEERFNAPAKAGKDTFNCSPGSGTDYSGTTATGRFPANFIHDGSDEVLELTGSAARFFYCAKASKAERQAGNNHPTVKPIALMRYLIKLVTPPNGTVLDPFLGSGTTAIAAVLEGFDWIGIEREAEYCDIAEARIAAAEIAIFIEAVATIRTSW